ncbi:hypothetical protein GGR56DRAFT_677141 [Xylariaceae sp. FL0804]|nr:hypothetical protein GGR56DRAFT_677141 [Xylariaceae sp. FL0804]
MRFPTRGTLALALAACAFSPAAVHAIIPPRQRLYGDTIVSHFGRRSASGARSLDCSREAIEDCMDATSNDATTCFGFMCAGRPLPVSKRDDECDEENLLQCAGQEWTQAQVCFEELCL